MSITTNIYIGPYVELYNPKDDFNLHEYIVETTNERLTRVYLDGFEYKLKKIYVPNYNGFGKSFHSCDDPSEIVDSIDINMVQELNHFQDKYKDVLEELEKHFDGFRVKHGVVFSTR